eukprot:gene33419-44747_t
MLPWPRASISRAASRPAGAGVGKLALARPALCWSPKAGVLVLVFAAPAHAVSLAIHPHDLNARTPGQGSLTITPFQDRRAAGPRLDGKGVRAVAGLNDGHQLGVGDGEAGAEFSAVLALEAGADRAVGVLTDRAGGDPDDPAAATAVALRLAAEQLDDPALRTRAAGELASRVAIHAGVRAALLAFQRNFAQQAGGAVLDGRDIGTVICPDAPAKLYVTATPEVRAERRWKQLRGQGEDVAFEDVLADIHRRDTRDGGREAAPMRPADDAVLLDTRTKKPLAIPAGRRIDEPFDNTWGVSDLLQTSVEHRINADWKITAAYSYNAETSTANQLRTTAVNPVTGVATRSNDGTGGSLSQDSYGTAYVQGNVWLGGLRNEVLFGGDAQYRVIYRKDLFRQNVSSVFNVYNPVYGRIAAGTTVSAADSEQTDKLGTRALFFQDTLHLTNQLAVVGGVRYMQFEQLAGKGRPFVTNTNLDGDKVLPLGGVIYKLTDQVSLYASYTQSLKPTSTIAAFSSSIPGFVVGSNIDWV